MTPQNAFAFAFFVVIGILAAIVFVVVALLIVSFMLDLLAGLGAWMLGRKIDQEEKEEEPAPAFPSIVCLCGSTRFMEAFFEAGWKFTLDGEIVLSVGICKHADADGAHGAEAMGGDVAERLDELHLRKIDLADHVHILNVGGYIGHSTCRELAYAFAKQKPISFLEPELGEEFMRENKETIDELVELEEL